MQKDTETMFVLFGSTGDLARRKVVPALCGLFAKKLLPERFRILAYSRRQWSDAEYREFILQALAAFHVDVVERFLQIIHHVGGVLDDSAGFELLKEKIAVAEALYYLAVQPELYPPIIEQLGGASLRGKLLIEKPFGRDLASAIALEELAETYFPPEQIFRVDHYLGKDGLAAFRATIHDENVVSITCRIFETIGVEGRGVFYDHTGALRDVGQSHLLQMVNALIPIHSLINPTTVARGQYEGYTSEPDVIQDSQTETYFNITTESSDPRWAGVPIILEAGKALVEKKSEIEVSFKDGSHGLFPMDLTSHDTGHETIIQAALANDQSYFVSLDDVLASWRFIELVLDQFPSVPLAIYKKGANTSDILHVV